MEATPVIAFAPAIIPMDGGAAAIYADDTFAAVESVGGDPQTNLFPEDILSTEDEDEAKRRGISSDKPLRIFITSDYPVDKGRSASAERMLQTAIEFSNNGHDVVLFAPSYVEHPEIAKGAKFKFRPVVFRPSGVPDWHSKGAPFVGFDIPVFDRNVQRASRKLFGQLSSQQVDQLMRAYAAHLDLMALIHGRPNVILTSHSHSIWGYVGSKYPTVAFTSDSDHIPKMDGQLPDNGVAAIMREAAKRAYKIIASARVTTGGHIFSEGKLEDGSGKIFRVGINLDMTLFAHKGEPGKEEMTLTYGKQLKGISKDDRWIVIYDRTGQPDIDRYLSSLGAEVLRNRKGTAIILLREGDFVAKASHVYRRARQFHTLDVSDDLNMKKRFLSVADAALIYIGGEGPPRSMDRMERDTIIATKTAIILKDKERRRVYLPGPLDAETSTKRMQQALREVANLAAKDFARNSGDLPNTVKLRTLDYITGLDRQLLIGEESPSADGARPSGDDFRSRLLGRRAIQLALRQLVARRFIEAAGTGKIDSSDPFMTQWRDDAKRDFPLSMESGIMTYLEPLFYEAAMKGKLISAPLDPTEPKYSTARRGRLQRIDYISELRLAHEALVDDLERLNGEADLTFTFGDWEDNVLRSLYIARMEPTVDGGGFFNPKRHPNGIFSEIARLSGVPYSDVVKLAIKIQGLSAERLVSKSEDGESRPPTAPPDFTPPGKVVQLDQHRGPDGKKH